MHTNKKIKIACLIIFLCLALSIFGEKITGLYQKEKKDEPTELLNIESFRVNASENFDGEYFIMRVGEKFTPEFTFLPVGISEFQQKLSWTNSDSSVLSINYNGEFTALKPGISNVIATSTKNTSLKEELKVKVVENYNAINFDYDLASKKQIYGVGQVVKLDYDIVGMISLGDVIWKSSNEEVATIDNGYLRALSLGKTTITVSSAVDENYHSSLDIEVRGYYNVVKATEVSFGERIKVDIVNYSLENFLKSSIRQENIVTLTAKANQEQARDVYFEFSNPDLVEVISHDKTEVTFRCVSTGDLTVKAISSYFTDVYSELTFTIKPFKTSEKISLKSPSVSEFENVDGEQILNINYGKIIPLTLTEGFNEINPHYLNITSSNEECIEVCDNYLKACGFGEAIITISDKNDSLNAVTFKAKVRDKSDRTYSKLEIMNCENVRLNNVLNKIVDYDVNIIHPFDVVEMELVSYPLYATNCDCFKVSLSNDIADVEVLENKIKLTFKALGQTSLIIKNYDNELLDIIYDFEVVNQNQVDFTYDSVSLLERGQTKNLNVKIDPSIIGTNIIYTSSNSEIASVGKNGEIVGLDYGTTEITIKVTDNETECVKKFSVEIIKEHSLYEALSSFSTTSKREGTEINLNETLLFVGDIITIDVSFEPAQHPFGKFHDIMIEDEDVLKLSKKDNCYTLTACKSGTTKILIYPYANSDFKEEYKVTVTNIMPEFMFISLPDKVMYVGDKYQFGYLLDWRATYNEVTITIDDDEIASLEDDYLVIKKEGTTSINFLIDDNDENSVNFLQTIDIKTYDHSNMIKIKRYGYLNFILRIIFQVISMFILGLAVVMIGLFQNNKKYLRMAILSSIFMVVIVVINIIKMNILFFGYEKYDMLLNIIFYLLGGCTLILIMLIKQKVERRKEKRSEENK